MLDSEAIQAILPHRYPFLLVDRIEELDPGKQAVGIKNVTANEPYFVGHFPHHAVFPGVLMIECIAQASAILASLIIDAQPSEKNVYLFAGIDKARFKRQIEPGDRLVIDVQVKRHVKQMWRCAGSIHVDEQLACAADVLFTHRNIE